MSVRVVAHEFEANATQRKLVRRNEDLEVTACRPWATDEQYQLLRTYLASRHPSGGMAGMDEQDYADMVEHSPVNSVIVEYREPSIGDRLGKLIGACLTDRQADGLSMIYSFFDVAEGARPGLGNLIILDHILRARAAGLPYVYLGYWVKGAARMAYKTRYRPIEMLGAHGWVAMEDAAEATPVPA